MSEDNYCVLSNDCGHLCEWCVQGEHRSYQVVSLLALPQKLERMFGALVARLRAVPVLRSRAEGDRL